MDNATTNAKRKLAEEHPDQPDATILKGTPWFEDGTIIIHAQSTRFKVYRGMLAEKSAIFADMLSLPRPASSSTTEDDDFDDGCPVVRLSDTAEDWGCMLDNLFNRRSVYPRTTIMIGSLFLMPIPSQTRIYALIISRHPFSLAAWPQVSICGYPGRNTGATHNHLSFNYRGLGCR